MNDDFAGDAIHLEPWVVLDHDAPACWRLDSGRDAIALFSDEPTARRYAVEIAIDSPNCIRPQPAELIRLLVQCVEAGLTAGVLDPDHHSARRIFDLCEVLRHVREDLRNGRPLSF